MQRRQFPIAPLSAIAGAIIAIGCSNAGTGLDQSITTTGAIVVAVYLDRDGSRTFTPGIDTLFPNASVGLILKNGTDTVKSGRTNSSGQIKFDNLPFGQYTVVVDPRSIGDSLQVQAIDSANIQVAANTAADSVAVRIGYPEVSIRQVRGMAAGRRVFIRGIILAGVQSFRDTTSHVADSSSQLRLTRVSLRGGIVGNSPGDSVSVLGSTSSRSGQPTLDNALISRIGARPAPVPTAISTGQAASASGGTLDAALVQVTGVNITDTATVAPDFEVKVTDGSGTLTILLDGNINFARGNFRPNFRTINVRGVLVPNGLGSWSLKPRDVGDVTFN
ncbi:MAG: hypothetical protein ABI647_01285 [Gemmatimonadota bacterium]